MFWVSIASQIGFMTARMVMAWIPNSQITESTSTTSKIPGKLLPTACSGRDRRPIQRKKSIPSPCIKNHKLAMLAKAGTSDRKLRYTASGTLSGRRTTQLRRTTRRCTSTT